MSKSSTQHRDFLLQTLHDVQHQLTTPNALKSFVSFHTHRAQQQEEDAFRADEDVLEEVDEFEEEDESRLDEVHSRANVPEPLEEEEEEEEDDLEDDERSDFSGDSEDDSEGSGDESSEGSLGESDDEEQDLEEAPL